MNTFQLDLGNLQINLTDEKLFVNTFASNETFALRSVNGLGVIDLIEAYNKNLNDWRLRRIILTIPVSIFLIAGVDKLIFVNNENIKELFLFVYIGIPFAIYKISYYLLIKPVLMSAVRIMLNSGNRDFQFDKAGVDSEAVAEFVARVESTLTAYHKKD